MPYGSRLMIEAGTQKALRASGIVKRFGEREALRRVGFEAAAGEVVAVIGPNGAGKTTLLTILAGIVEPDEGQVESSGGGVGWVPQQAALYRRLTVAENLLLFARLQGHDDVRGRVERMLELTGLADRRDDQVGKLSGGNQQRINIAIGLMADPSVLLLDEPSVGLDPAQRARLWQFILGLVTNGTAVVFSTHDIQEAERYAGRIFVVAEGTGVFDGTATELRDTVISTSAPAPEESGQADLETSFLAFLSKEGH